MSDKIRYTGTYVGDRKNADEAIKVAAERMAVLVGEMVTRPDTKGHANRLADYVRDVKKALRTAELFLDQRGEE